MSPVAYRFASASDIDRFFGSRPAPTMKAIVITVDDEPAGIIGFARMAACICMFSEYKDTLAPHLRSMTVLRALKAAMKMIGSFRLPVTAVADNPVLLTRLGFRPSEDPEVYEWHS